MNWKPFWLSISFYVLALMANAMGYSTAFRVLFILCLVMFVIGFLLGAKFVIERNIAAYRLFRSNRSAKEYTNKPDDYAE